MRGSTRRSSPPSSGGPAHVTLGPFAVGEVIGEGGMGRVHAGVHARTGLPVAIKVVTSERAASPAAVRRFGDEIRAMARLDHPHVIRVLDLGVLTAAEARALDAHTGGAPGPAGSPYVVMERCSGGRLARDQVRTWSRLHDTLRALLDALAHAHARDVLHLDLKRSNVLEGTTADDRPGLKIIDFGLSWLARVDDDGPIVAAGSPRTMAPEQILGRRRDLGPWTDLYALGCVAYELACGRPPFRGTPHEIVTAHLGAAAPALACRFEAPRGLDAWVNRLLAKDPQGRFACAADAARALAAVGEADPSTWVPPASRQGSDGHDDDPTLTAAPQRSGTFAAHPGPGSRRSAAPAPPSFRLPAAVPALDDEDAAAHLDRGAAWREMPAGLGLRLYALRAAPFIGRAVERRRLWSALERVAREGGARAVVVQGAEGLGKTRLASWLAERAHELGAATVLRASHDLAPHAGTGLGAIVARAGRAAGLPVDEVETRLQRLAGDALRPDELRLLADVVAGGVEVTSSPVEPSRRFEAVRRLLRAMARDRPLVVVLDDDEGSAEAAALVEHALATQIEEPAPILFVVTARSEHVADRPALARSLAALARRTAAETIELGPLPSEEHALLVRSLLGLSGELAARVEASTAGDPAFAIALVGDWVDRGLLEPGDAGFRLARGASVDLPRRLAEPWIERTRRVLDREDVAGCRAVEIAAALGATVDEGPWREACARTAADDGVLDRLIRAQLAHHAGEGDDGSPRFAFAHAAVRQHVHDAARRAGRLEAACALAAEVLAGGARTAERDERRGRALLLARRWVEAADVLLASAEVRHGRGEIAWCLELLELAEEALRGSSLGEADERWGSLAALRASAWLRGGVLAAPEALLAQAIDDARRHGWRRALPELLFASSTMIGQRGRHQESAAQLREALDGFLALGDARGCNKTLRCLAHIDRQGGRLDEAEAHLRRALELADAADDDELRGWSLQGLAAVASARGRHDDAGATIGAALDALERSGSAFAQAHAHNTAGEIARRRGDPAAAERAYARAVDRASAVGSFIRHVARLNHGLMLLEQGRVDEAETQLLRCLRVASEAGIALLDYGARSGLAVCAAVGGRLGAVDEHLDALAVIAERAVDAEVAGWIERAGKALRDRGDLPRAEAAARIAAAFRGATGS